MYRVYWCNQVKQSETIPILKIICVPNDISKDPLILTK